MQVRGKDPRAAGDDRGQAGGLFTSRVHQRGDDAPGGHLGQRRLRHWPAWALAAVVVVVIGTFGGLAVAHDGTRISHHEQQLASEQARVAALAQALNRADTAIQNDASTVTEDLYRIETRITCLEVSAYRTC